MSHYLLHQKVLSGDLNGVQELIDNRVSLDALDKLGQTPLHWAVFKGDLEIAKALLQAGANPNIRSSDGESTLWRASDFGLTEMESLLTSFGATVTTSEKKSL